MKPGLTCWGTTAVVGLIIDVAWASPVPWGWRGFRYAALVITAHDFAAIVAAAGIGNLLGLLFDLGKLISASNGLVDIVS